MQNTSIDTKEPKLFEKLSFGAGDFGFNLYWTSISAFLLIFYTDVFGLPAKAAGTMLLITKIADAFADPIMGAVSDRTRTKWGRFRPWFIWGALPLAIVGILTFYVPDLPDNQKLIYAYLTFGILMIVYSVVNIPYNALSGVITNDAKSRTELNSMRFVGGFLGGTFVTFFTPKLVSALGNGNDSIGYLLTMVIYGILACALFFNIFSSTKERIEPIEESNQNGLSDIVDLLKNAPWMVLFALSLILMITITLRMGASAYYMKYYIKMPDLTSAFLTTYGFALAFGALATPFITKYIDKKKLLFILLSLVGIISSLFYFVPRDAFWAMFVLQALIGFCLGPKSPLVFSMYADCADYNEHKSGRRATGMTFAAATFSQKLGGALASFIIASVLAKIEYVANQVQTHASEQGILLLVSIIPGVIALIAAATMIFYDLDKNKLTKIQMELEAKRNAAIN